VTANRIPKKLLILGATGRALLEQARGRGHEVTALVRSPEKLGAPRDGVTVRKGDSLDAAELRAILAGGDGRGAR